MPASTPPSSPDSLRLPATDPPSRPPARRRRSSVPPPPLNSGSDTKSIWVILVPLSSAARAALAPALAFECTNEQEAYSVGRGANNHLVLKGGGKISGRHATIRRFKGEEAAEGSPVDVKEKKEGRKVLARLEDCSTNGTSIDGTKIRGRERAVRDGDEIVFGPVAPAAPANPSTATAVADPPQQPAEYRFRILAGYPPPTAAQTSAATADPVGEEKAASTSAATLTGEAPSVTERKNGDRANATAAANNGGTEGSKVATAAEAIATGVVAETDLSNLAHSPPSIAAATVPTTAHRTTASPHPAPAPTPSEIQQARQAWEGFRHVFSQLSDEQLESIHLALDNVTIVPDDEATGAVEPGSWATMKAEMHREYVLAYQVEVALRAARKGGSGGLAALTDERTEEAEMARIAAAGVAIAPPSGTAAGDEVSAMPEIATAAVLAPAVANPSSTPDLGDTTMATLLETDLVAPAARTLSPALEDADMTLVDFEPEERTLPKATTTTTRKPSPLSSEIVAAADEDSTVLQPPAKRARTDSEEEAASYLREDPQQRDELASSPRGAATSTSTPTRATEQETNSLLRQYRAQGLSWDLIAQRVGLSLGEAQARHSALGGAAAVAAREGKGAGGAGAAGDGDDGDAEGIGAASWKRMYEEGRAMGLARQGATITAMMTAGSVAPAMPAPGTPVPAAPAVARTPISSNAPPSVPSTSRPPSQTPPSHPLIKSTPASQLPATGQHYKQHYVPWTPAEEAQMRQLRENKVTWHEVGVRLGRTALACQSRWTKMKKESNMAAGGGGGGAFASPSAAAVLQSAPLAPPIFPATPSRVSLLSTPAPSSAPLASASAPTAGTSAKVVTPPAAASGAVTLQAAELQALIQQAAETALKGFLRDTGSSAGVGVGVTPTPPPPPPPPPRTEALGTSSSSSPKVEMKPLRHPNQEDEPALTAAIVEATIPVGTPPSSKSSSATAVGTATAAAFPPRRTCTCFCIYHSASGHLDLVDVGAGEEDEDWLKAWRVVKRKVDEAFG